MSERFIQPDTVVPRPGNPQSLNRYSYVDDNPLRYTDPSGHMFIACGEGEGCGGEKPPLRVAQYGDVPELWANPTPVPPELKPYSPSLYVVSPWEPTPPEVYQEKGLRILLEWGSLLWGTLDKAELEHEMQRAFLHANVFDWGRAVNPFPGLDAVLGGTSQLLEDFHRKDLTLWQRGGRVVLVGGESAVTGMVSDTAFGVGADVGATAGGVIEPAGGEVLGLPTGIASYVGSSLWMDRSFWMKFNRIYFNRLGEWSDETP